MSEAPSSSESNPDRSTNDTRILVVDDEPALRMGFRLALVTEGFQVEVAANGEEALQKLEHETFNVMILDLRMPGIDGIGVLTHLADHSVVIPTVIASAQTDSRVALQALRMGSVDFLNKPIRPNDLRSIVNKVVTEEVDYLKGIATPLQRTRCLLRRRAHDEALQSLQSVYSKSPAESLWKRVAATLCSPESPKHTTSPVSLQELSNWDK